MDPEALQVLIGPLDIIRYDPIRQLSLKIVRKSEKAHMFILTYFVFSLEFFQISLLSHSSDAPKVKK